LSVFMTNKMLSTKTIAKVMANSNLLRWFLHKTTAFTGSSARLFTCMCVCECVSVCEYV